MTRVCVQDGCDRKHVARGLCGTHYNQTHQTNRHPLKEVQCVVCGKQVMKATGGGRKHGATCSNACRQSLNPGPSVRRCELPADHWARMYGATSAWPRGRDMWSPLREALFTSDYTTILTEIRKDCAVNGDGCWVWQRSFKKGYPFIQYTGAGGRSQMLQVHRLTLEAKHRAPLGSQAAHHMCANSTCVNPDHLQPVSHNENTAEMMQRQYYVARIRELEDALASLSPEHVLLTHVGLPAVA